MIQLNLIMTSFMRSKQHLLQKMLARIFDNKLTVLEQRTKDHVDSLQFTKKVFGEFDKSIQKLIKYNNVSKDKGKKIKPKLQEQYLISNQLNLSQRQYNKNKNSASGASTPISKIKRSITFSSKSFRHPNSKSLTEKQMSSNNNKSILGPLKKQKSMFIRNHTPFNIHKYNNNNNISLHYSVTSPSITNKKYPYMRSKSSKHSLNTTHRPHELRKELLSIQEQIKNVEYSILTTEKEIERQRSLNNSQIFSITSPNKYAKYKRSIYHKYLQNKNEIITHIITYLNNNDKFSLMYTSKYYFKEFALEYLNDVINKYKGNNNRIDKEIMQIQKKYSHIDLNNEYNEFVLSRGALKATDLLDQELYNKLFMKYDLDESMKEIINIYKIFYQLINKEDFVSVKNDNTFWKKNCQFISKESNDKIGSLLISKVKHFCFEPKNVYKLKHMIEPIKHKLFPSYFSKICGTTSLVIFIIKDALEFCGALTNDKKTPPSKLIDNLTYEKEHILSKLNHLKTLFTDM